MSDQSDIEAVLDRQSPKIRELAELVRAQVKAIRPELSEDASVKLGVIYFRHQGVVCALSPHKAHVNLHFYKGVELSDPDGVLQGSGKALRHLKFRKAADLDPAVLAPLLNEAYQLNQ